MDIKTLDIKTFDSYSDEERATLLMHWWYYYGKVIVNFDECMQFYDLVKKDSRFMMDVALCSFIDGKSSQYLIGAMRIGKVGEYLGTVKELTKLPSYKKTVSELEKPFLTEVVGTYNNPEPSIPFTIEDIVSQTVEQLANRNNKDNGVAYVKKDSTITTE